MPTERTTGGVLIARLDRIPVWSLPGLFIGIIGVGFLFTFYDIFDINVSFIQTCIAIVPAARRKARPASRHPGAAEPGRLRDRHAGAKPARRPAGRRDLLLVTMLITGIGSLATAFVGSYGWFVAARTLTGIGIGADLAIVNTYIGEMAPREGRGKYTALVFVFSAVGAVAGIWLGLILTTPRRRSRSGCPSPSPDPASRGAGG